ncbi:MAG: hypothetical protein KAS72_09345 [Phycisphaerales bacterium]|nr:hypothetical protein [Phycisphaerales bacterium]
MIIESHAFARIGLIGNPSDGYGGKTISTILRNFQVTVTCEASLRLVIEPCARDRMEFDGINALVAHVNRHGYYGGVRLIKATIKRFAEYCREQGVKLDERAFTMHYETNVPTRVGLAGSSAIVIAALRALMQFYDVTLPGAGADAVLPALALSVEVDELKIPAGLQDRVIQTIEGVAFMDFGPRNPHSAWEKLDPAQLPPLFVAYDEGLSEGTEVVHSGLRSRFDHGDAKVVEGMQRFAELAQEARDLIVAGRGDEIRPLMDANFDLRSQLVSIDPGARALVETARRQGASAKFTGSGGAVVGIYDGDPQRYERLRSAYAAIGATVIKPEIC